MAIKVLKNTTNVVVPISDAGVEVSALGQYTIIPTDYQLFADSVDVIAHINAGTLVVNDGTNDLSPTLAINYMILGELVPIWNADKIQGVLVDDTLKANGKVLQYNSATSNLEYATVSGGGGGSSIFGTDKYIEESLGVTSTTSTSFIAKLDKDFTGLVSGGEYIIFFYSEIRFEDEDSGIHLKLSLNGVAQTSPIIRADEQDEEWGFWSGHATTTLSTTTLNVKLEFRTGDSSELASMQKTKVIIWRIS